MLQHRTILCFLGVGISDLQTNFDSSDELVLRCFAHGNAFVSSTELCVKDANWQFSPAILSSNRAALDLKMMFMNIEKEMLKSLMRSKILFRHTLYSAVFVFAGVLAECGDCTHIGNNKLHGYGYRMV